MSKDDIYMDGQSLSVPLHYLDYITVSQKCSGLNRDLNPGPPAPKAGIIPLDH